MAIDSASKRAAMLCMSTGPVRASLPAPVGGLTVLERGAVLQLFTDTLDAPSEAGFTNWFTWFGRVGSIGQWS